MASKILKTANRTLSVLQRGSSAIISVQHVRRNARKKSVWTQEGIIKSPFKNVEIPNCNLNEFIWQNLDKWPKKTMAVSLNYFLISNLDYFVTVKTDVLYEDLFLIDFV